MGLAELLAALEEDAQDEVVRLERDAQAQASRIVSEAEQRAGELRAQVVAAAEASAAADVNRVLGEARLEAASVLRTAREAAFRSLLDDVRERLSALRADPIYPRVLRALIHEAVAALPAGRVLRIDPRDQAVAARVLRGLDRDELTVEPGLRTAGGLELASLDHRLVRNTLEERLANAEATLRLRLAAALSETTRAR